MLLTANGAHIAFVPINANASLDHTPIANDYSCGLFSLSRRVAISFACGHDRALHQHMPYLRELLGVVKLRFLRQAMDDGADFRKMNGGRLANRSVRFRLQQCIDERATSERGLVKPAVENVKDGQQSRFWIYARSLISALSQPRVHTTSRRSRNAMARSDLESKLS